MIYISLIRSDTRVAHLRITSPGYRERIVMLTQEVSLRIDPSVLDAKITAEPVKAEEPAKPRKPLTLPHLDLDYLNRR